MQNISDDEFFLFLWDNLPTRDRLHLLQHERRTVWLFGAGASRHYGLNLYGVNMPLARDFFSAMHKLPTAHGLHAHIGPLLAYLHQYRGVHPIDAIEWSEDIEEFMTSVERELAELGDKKRKGQLTDEDREKSISLSTVFNNMTFILANVLNEAQDGSSHSAYSELLTFCSPEDTFITFNWDTLLDKALAMSGAWNPNDGYGVCFSAVFDGCWRKAVASAPVLPSNWRLLKLHGSTNWLVPYTGVHLESLQVESIAGEGDEVFLFWHASLPYETHRGRWRGGYGPTCYGYYPPNLPKEGLSAKGILLGEGKHHASASYKRIFAPFDEPVMHGVPSSPLIITPVRQKKYEDYAGTIEKLWGLAERALSEADRIVLIGYSFPQTDTQTLSLLQNALSKRENQIELVIVDPSASMIQERIGDKYIAKAKGVSIYEQKFEDYVSALRQEVPSLVKAISAREKTFAEWVQKLEAFQNWPGYAGN